MLPGQVGARNASPDVGCGFHHRVLQYRHGAGDKRQHAGCRLIVAPEIHAVGVAQPARQRRPGAVLQIAPDIGQRRRTRPATQVFVAAHHREIGAAAGEIDRHRAGTVRQVPQHPCADRMGLCIHLRHIPAKAAAVVHMREQHQCQIIGERRIQTGGVVDRACLPAAAAVMHDALHHMTVGGKALTLINDHALLRRRCRQAQAVKRQFVQIESGVVAGDHLIGRRADQVGVGSADALRRIEPVGHAPGMAALGRPFLVQGAQHACARRLRQCTHRIGIEINAPARRRFEGVAQRGERIACVQRFADFKRDHGSPTSPDCRFRGASCSGATLIMPLSKSSATRFSSRRRASPKPPPPGKSTRRRP